MGTLFGTDGIRGQANRHPVTCEIALKLGKAIGRVVDAGGYGSRKVVLGKDTRLSGYMIETALTSGLVSMGVDVLLVGPVPTPAVAHLVRSLAADMGIMVTASHNPFDDNGIKIFGADGFKLDDATEEELERLIASDDLSSSAIRSDQIGKAFRIDDACGRYIEFAKVSIGTRPLKGIRIVLDCANGAAYWIAPTIFRELGAEVIAIHDRPDGRNINNECGALHPEHMAGLVRQRQATFGIALDGDADRVIFADEHGAIVDGDRILAICARDYKQRGLLAGDTIVCTSMSNLGLHDAMRRIGVSVATTDVGDRKVIEAMREGGFRLGGEKSGHLIFLDYATTGDGIMSALYVARLLVETGRTLGDLARDCMDEYPQKLVSLPVREKPPIPEIPALADAIGRAAADLGGTGRVIVRYSGTERKIRLLVEAATEEKVGFWMDRLVEAVHASLS
ncbi:MAG: phosphoglucosamine mutase [Kiritimatiellia bacterium]|jgi:phosphoglucosamine mutase